MLTTEFWKKYFEVYDLLNILEPYQDVLEKMIEKASVKYGDKILDAGSGTGNLAIKLEHLGASVIALDSSIEGLEIHKRKVPNAQIIHGDLTQPLPFSNDFFDKICSNNTIYTLPKETHKFVFKEFFRILKPGGVIVVSNPRVGFSPMAIYLDHLKYSFKNNGFFKTLFLMTELLLPTVKIFYYNVLIKSENKTGSYTFFNFEEQAKILKSSGFVEVSRDLSCYAGQAIMNSAVKSR